MRHKIKAYALAMTNSWAESTKTKRTQLLLSLVDVIDGNPKCLWDHLHAHAPYTRATVFSVVGSFWAWAHGGANPYKQFVLTNRNLFKNVYVKERLDLTYEEAQIRIDSIPQAEYREHARAMLCSAQRWCESVQPAGLGYVIGKGGKPRPDFRPTRAYEGAVKSYSGYYAALRKVGLKPHTLRKLALTRLAEKGATASDLCEVAGWATIRPAMSYLQPKNTQRLKEMLA